MTPSPKSSTPASKSRALDSRVGYHVVRSAMLIRRRYAEALGEFGLLPNQHAILAVVSTSGPMSQKQVAELTTVDAGDLVSYLDGLQARGAISRDRDPGDRRRHLVDVTASGRKLLSDADDALDRAESELFGDLSATERRSFIDLLDGVSQRAADSSH